MNTQPTPTDPNPRRDPVLVELLARLEDVLEALPTDAPVDDVLDALSTIDYDATIEYDEEVRARILAIRGPVPVVVDWTRFGLVDREDESIERQAEHVRAIAEREGYDPVVLPIGPVLFPTYFNVADELSDPTMTLDDLDPEYVDVARIAARELDLPFPPSLPAAEEYANAATAITRSSWTTPNVAPRTDVLFRVSARVEFEIDVDVRISDPDFETTRILSDLVRKIERDGIDELEAVGDEVPLRDLNGNRVGSARFEIEEVSR